jgi:hypothetical protein
MENHGEKNLTGLLTHPPELWQSYQQSLLGASRMDKRSEDLAVQAFLFTCASDFLHTVKSWDMGYLVLLPNWRKLYCGFLWPLKIHRLSTLKPETPESSGRHTNHYTTEATNVKYQSQTTGISWLSDVMELKVTDNPKLQLKQRQSKHGSRWM